MAIKSEKHGDPGPIRTGDLPLRRGTLYPAELRSRISLIIAADEAFGQSVNNSDILPKSFVQFADIFQSKRN
jgi:hypothetical protein